MAVCLMETVPVTLSVCLMETYGVAVPRKSLLSPEKTDKSLQVQGQGVSSLSIWRTHSQDREICRFSGLVLGICVSLLVC